MFSTNSVFRNDWKTALKDAKKGKNRVFFVFHTDWCPHCRMLFKTTLKDKKMLDYFKKENYVLIEVNPEKDKVAESTFKVYGYPTTIVFDKKGDEIDRILGYLTTEQMIKTLEGFKIGKGTLKDYLKRYKKEKNNLKLMNDIATKYIARADFAKAIKILDELIAKAKGKDEKMEKEGFNQKAYAYYKWKKFEKAAAVLLSIKDRFSEKDRKDALFGAAYYFEKGKNKKKAIEVYKELIKRFPDSPEARKIKEKIKKLSENS
jgi:thioredoxin-related protein